MIKKFSETRTSARNRYITMYINAVTEAIYLYYVTKSGAMRVEDTYPFGLEPLVVCGDK